MRKIWETGIILFSAMGFWGMIYPDLCFTEDVCGVVWEEAEEAEGESGTGTGGSATGKDPGGDKDGTRSGQDAEIARGDMDEESARGSITGTKGDMFTRICSAEPGQIRIKSKFLEAVGLDKLLQ